jgi:hypothetical protein
MLFVFGFGFVIGAVLGAFIVALAAAADKEVPRSPARLHLYHPRDQRIAQGSLGRVYQIHTLRPGDVLAVEGRITSEAFSGSDRAT